MKVGVVGLGLAGLRAAQLLERAGAEVVLFDARPRIGGRLHSVEPGGLPHHEAGAQWIDAEHARIVALLAELGLAPRARPGGEGLAVFGGERCSDAALWDDAAEDAARVESLAAKLGLELPDDLAPDDRLRQLDDAHLDGFLREQTRSPRGRLWLEAKYRADEGDDLDRIGLLGWLVGFRLYARRQGGEMCALRLPVAASELCRRMLGTLHAPPRLDHALRAVENRATSVTLHFGNSAEVCDRAVLALPPPCLAEVRFDPPLPPAQAAAQRAHRMGRAVKFGFEFETPFWREQGWNGDLAWDGPLQQTWDGSLGEAPVLCAYVCGEQAVAWSRMADPLTAGVEQLATLFPEARRSYVRGAFHDWVSPPFSGGVHSHLPPGFVLQHLRHETRPAGRVHFAGEHTATWTGFMEGALESAERATRELLAA